MRIGVADAVGEQRAEADGRLERARPLGARLGDAEVERVVDLLASRRFEAIVFGTLVDLIETLKFSKSRRSISSTNSTAAVTSASTGFSRSSSCRCLGSEPELTPMRIGTPAALAFSATSAALSGPPMLPGLRRMQCAPASIAFSASVWLKWMSAITGIGDSTTRRLSASTSFSRGTATRTRSRAGVGDRPDLLQRGVVVGRLGLRHRLDGDRRAAADLDSAHVDLPLEATK